MLNRSRASDQGKPASGELSCGLYSIWAPNVWYLMYINCRYVGCKCAQVSSPRHNNLQRSPWPSTMESNTKTILEFLTEKNPAITYPHPRPKGSNTGSSSRPGAGYLYPTRLLPWNEFTLNTLQTIFDGELYRFLQQDGKTLGSFPQISTRTDTSIRCENSTRHILTKWNHGIVQSAIDALQETFNVCDWSPYPGKYMVIERDDPPNGPKMEIVSTSSNLHLNPQVEQQNTEPTQQKRGHKLIPDSGTTRVCPELGLACKCSLVERLPKEYKPYPKFDSSKLGLLLDKDGKFLERARDKNRVLPIRQAFTYCIRRGCRYGCILTTDEAFIFRIQLTGQQPESSAETPEDDEMINCTLYYTSIPWSSSSSSGLTFNLALWFIHVLAGNSYRLEYQPYNTLVNEPLEKAACLLPRLKKSPSPKSNVRQSAAPRTSRKRKLQRPEDDSDDNNDEGEDTDPAAKIHQSFTEDDLV